MSPARRVPEPYRATGPGGPDSGFRATVDEGRTEHRPAERRAAWRFRNWRVRSKIVVLLLIPLLAVVTLSWLRLGSVLDDMSQASRSEQVSRLSLDMTALVDELQAERDLTGNYLGQRRNFGGESVTEKRGKVDAERADYEDAVADLDGDFGSVVTDRLSAVRASLANLEGIRNEVDQGGSAWPALNSRYTDIITNLLRLEEAVAQGNGDTELLQSARALTTVSRTKELLSAERGYLSYVYGIGRFEGNEYRQFLELDARYRTAVEQMQAALTAPQRDLYARKVTDTVTAPVDTFKESTLNSPTADDLGIRPNEWFNAVGKVLEPVRQVEIELGGQVVDRASALSDDARTDAALDGGIVLIVLVVTVILALFILQSLVRPLRRLRTSAVTVAQDLPATVRRLRSTEPSEIDTHVEPLRVKSTDEVGDVAAAFNSVHREAVRVAVEQALLRKNVSTMFVNLSRRTQGLVERQLRLIDDLEGSQEDSEVLGELFQLDHLATRMRRSAENLLVLAGSESGRRWNQPVVLLDVLRAASAEVEQYPRVAQTFVADRQVDGRAVADVIHLIAELLENALEFSSPETQVVLSARSLPGDAGVMVQIEDRGIGMSEEELATANERLSSAAEIDVSLSRMMGLYVVGMLAARHEIRAQLAHSGYGGVIAMIHLPSSVVIDERGAAPAEPVATPAPAPLAPAPVPAPHEYAPDTLEPDSFGSDSFGSDSFGSDSFGSDSFGSDTFGSDSSGPDSSRPDSFGSDTFGPDSFGDPSVDLGDHETRPIFDHRNRPRPFLPDEPGQPAQPGQQGQTEDAGPAGAPAPPDEDFAEQFDRQFGEPVPVGVAAGGPDEFTQTLPVNGTGPHAPDQVDLAELSFGPSEATQLIGPPTGPVPVAPQAPVPPPEEPAMSIADALSMAPEAPAPAEPEADSGGEEYLPIYAQVESEWFRRRTRPEPARAVPAGMAPLGSNAAAVPPPPPPPAAPSQWRSVADEGWKAAEQIAKPRVSGTTKAGLPVRVPMAHYVPGSAQPPGPADAAQPPQDGAPSPESGAESDEHGGTRTPETVRGLLSNYQRGLRQGREAGRHRVADGEQYRTEQ